MSIRIVKLDKQSLPIPARASARRGGRPALYDLASMNPGDCIQISGSSFGAVYAAIYRYQRKNPARFRALDCKTSVKVWRIS